MKTETFISDVPARAEVLEFIDYLSEPHVDHSVGPIVLSPIQWSSYRTHYEEITPNNYGSWRDWKSFEHYKCVSGKPSSIKTPIRTRHHAPASTLHYHVAESHDPVCGYPPFLGIGIPTFPYGQLGDLSYDLPEFYSKRPDGGFVPPPDDLEGLSKRALSTMLPNIKEELSLLNSIIELKDFKRLPKSLKEGRAVLSRFFSGKYGLGASLRRLTKLGADAYLTNSFAFKPLVSDVLGIFRALQRTEKRMNFLISSSGKKVRRHFSWRFAEYNDVDEEHPTTYYLRPPLEDPHTLDGVQLRRRVRYTHSHFHAMIEYNYNYTQYQVEHARILSVLDAFGVNLNPAIIWNAIPWSFVVDWLVDVQGYLDDTLKRQNMAPKINIHRYLWSIKRAREITVFKKLKLIQPGYPISGFSSYTPPVTQTSYRRAVGLPGASSIESSGLNSKEFSLGAALVIARSRRI